MKKKFDLMEHWKIISMYLIIYDVLAINAAYFIALWLRFDLRFSMIPSEYLTTYLKFAPIYTIFALILFNVLHLYNSVWRFASFTELNRIAIASLITMVFHTVFINVLFDTMPISYYIFGAVLQAILITAVRFGYRYINLERSKKARDQRAIHNVMVVGAGSAGQVLLKELNSSHEMASKPMCVIDDNPNKWNRYIEGVPIVGGKEKIIDSVKKYNIDRILIAMPSASPQEKKEILDICKETKCELKILPGIYQLAKGEVTLSQMKDVAVEDLLGRDPIKVNMDEIFEYIQDKVIMVTGGGGSIGSELCRQIASHHPKQLIIFDIYENNAYEIEQELKCKYRDELNLVTLIGSVRDSKRMDMVFKQYRPQIVYHAAAHKHVPLMETSPNESIKNNVIGTYKTAYAAIKYGTERFELISTDKAVNPTNIMGASKRLCEMTIQAMDKVAKSGKLDLLPSFNEHSKDDNLTNTPCKTSFVAVRFGNVLGSNGSVIPLFKKQILNGGPVTVTHPDIVRYFMTIPEAVSLVMQAGTYAKGGEIFVLDMGDPVKIDTLARNLIKLSGFTPDKDIKIVYSGLRPGEKLYEEKLMAEEGLEKTDNKLIHIGKPIPFDTDIFWKQLDELAKASYKNSNDIIEMVANIVNTFTPTTNK